ncbi:tetratricopeptide repeat protein 8 [Lutzomyia longipalpis]|uniref:tetratricopeptide repeat protein 8 n=1 Tax=Lutzomyia longipalpis TaxID=7200 RepID=UPI0024834611|nr:tetratricopeptide repeat protein 8 [Lutzomyia longipalpis]
MDIFFEAVSLYRKRKYDECIEVCNTMLKNNGDQRLQRVWELKMRALTQRVYVDDIEADDGIDENDDLDTSRLATAPRPGTTMRTSSGLTTPGAAKVGNRPTTSAGRPLTGMARPGTMGQTRPGSSMVSRTAPRTGSRSGTARNIRLGSASIFTLHDPAGPLVDVARLNPAVFAAKKTVAHILFSYLYYHEGDVRKALELCDAATSARSNQGDWWWNMQKGRCLITLGNPRKAEQFLRAALSQCAHPDVVLLLARIYVKIDQPLAALEVCRSALDRLPGDVSLLTQQARILELVGNLPASVRMYRLVAQFDATSSEALACIAVHHFYGNQPEMALLHYRRILSMGVNSAELHCNLALCCLYGGQLDLVMPCFQRAFRLATSTEQRADIWYNCSFAALTSGDFNLARRCLRLCISCDGSHGAALNNLAVLAAKAGQRSKARSYLAAAKSALPDSPEIHHNLEHIDSAK